MSSSLSSPVRYFGYGLPVEESGVPISTSNGLFNELLKGTSDLAGDRSSEGGRCVVGLLLLLRVLQGDGDEIGGVDAGRDRSDS